ncbi:GPI anchored cell wall protein, putative [Trichophyton verrucosum HKI 0517]|uniref:GPI anchored cell wall protein, putative n=1 Tax=Trichophyton verrucosum (strain HKI 0517) TaxID=663202 RepID=D4D6E4_TRIVH|nr:GPI anchored cell wall protein, putative [Trichophyton verrucosum HKI 0517]EFE42588.1 GPI anchored cell wall protein, putative [Trichophyton verrucosum HKI 0517]
MMLKSVLSALVHLGLAAAASSSSAPASTTQSGSPSPTISIFFPNTARPTDGPIVTPLADASVVSVKEPLTTVAVCINFVSRHSCEADMLQTFTVGGTTLLEYNEVNTDEGMTGMLTVETRTIHGGCTIHEAATCSVSFSTAIASFSTNMVETTTYPASEVTYVPVTITAGAEKLPKATQTSGTGGPSGTGKPNSGPKATGMPNLALLGGAAVFGNVYGISTEFWISAWKDIIADIDWVASLKISAKFGYSSASPERVPVW